MVNNDTQLGWGNSLVSVHMYVDFKLRFIILLMVTPVKKWVVMKDTMTSKAINDKKELVSVSSACREWDSLLVLVASPPNYWLHIRSSLLPDSYPENGLGFIVFSFSASDFLLIVILKSHLRYIFLRNASSSN